MKIFISFITILQPSTAVINMLYCVKSYQNLVHIDFIRQFLYLSITVLKLHI
jgi:hypothetical protein